MTASELDYDFEVEENDYFAVHETGFVNILDYEGERLFSLDHRIKTAYPLASAQSAVVGYIAGVEAGKVFGELIAQRAMRKALGL